MLSNIYLVSIESDDEDVSSDSDDEMLNYVLDEHLVQMLEGLSEQLEDEMSSDFYSSSEETEPMVMTSEDEF